MKILVIDDSQDQLDFAKASLHCHDVTTALGWSEARAQLTDNGKPTNPSGFEVVLTDLMMPGEPQGLSNMSQVGKLVPYGFIIALLAIRCGVPKVAVVSNGQGDDGNHHHHPILWASDDLTGFNFENRLLFFTGYSCPFINRYPWYIKDWVTVLRLLLELTNK